MQVEIRREATYMEVYVVDIPDGMSEEEAFEYAWEEFGCHDPVKTEFTGYTDWYHERVIR